MSIYSAEHFSSIFTGIGPVIPKDIHEKIGYNKFTTKEYLDSSAASKLASLWSSVVETEGTEGSWPGIKLAGIFIESMDPTFKQAGDVFTEGIFGHRTKYIHSVGVTSKVKFEVIAGTKFTGIFAGGCTNGLIRLSSAVEPSASQMVAPGMGLKCLRDNMDSANLVSMFSVEGNPKDDWNFFSQDFKNHITAANSTATKALSAKFATETSFIQEVGLSDWAMFSE